MLRLLMMLGCFSFVLLLAGCPSSKAPADGAAPPGPPAAATPPAARGPVDGAASVTAPASVVAGSVIDLTFTGPGNDRDYLDLVPRGMTETSGQLTYVYVRDHRTGSRLKAVIAPGEYDVRYVAELATGPVVKAVAPITVTAATATVSAPATALAAEVLQVSWTGPGGDADYIDIVEASVTDASGDITYAYTRDGNPAKLTMPGPAGDYRIRYVLDGPGGRSVLAAAPVRVSTPPASLTAPPVAKRGESIVVEYEGPKRAGDYVDIVKKGYLPPDGELGYFSADGASANRLTMPAEAGEYELRYVMVAPRASQVLVRRGIKVK